MPEREPISPRDAEATRRTVELLGLNDSTVRYLGLSGTRQLENAMQGRAKLTDWQADQLRLANRERDHVEAMQDRNRAQDRSLPDNRRDRAILDWLRAGKEKGGDQSPAGRRVAIKALGALGYDPSERAIYKRKGRR